MSSDVKGWLQAEMDRASQVAKDVANLLSESNVTIVQAKHVDRFVREHAQDFGDRLTELEGYDVDADLLEAGQTIAELWEDILELTDTRMVQLSELNPDDWHISSGGNLTKIENGLQLTIFEDKGGGWKYAIRVHAEPLFSDQIYESEAEALTACEQRAKEGL